MIQERTNKRLDEVTLMRCILALLIVFMHSFTCYNGGWPEPAGFVNVPIYKWMSRFSFAFTLQAFVFVAGYLFAFQRITLNRSCGFMDLVSNKLKRLILPSIIFSALYYVFFYKYEGVGKAFYSIINGCGHMWFLPMLFWCFVGGWLLEKVKIDLPWKLLFLFFLNIFWLNFVPLPFQLNRAIPYLFFFYVGVLVYKYSSFLKMHLSWKYLVLSWVTFLIVFVLFRPLRDVLIPNDTNGRIINGLIMAGNNLCLLLYGITGLLAFYYTAVFYTQRKEINSFIVQLASFCFGIYLFQQFILQFLYYKTSFPAFVGPYWLPWCGFVIAISCSIMLSVFLLRTKVGRFLIG